MAAPKHLILDLDNTMYPKSSGLDEAMRQRIVLYLVERHGLSFEQATELRQRYVREFGLSLPGIMRDFPVDVADYQAFIHDVDISCYIKPDPALRGFLDRCSLSKVIFTNSSNDHVARVLDALGIKEAAFTRIIDYTGAGFRSKPQPEAFEAMLAQVGAEGPECIMVDDLPKTVCVAKKQFGMRCVLVDEDETGGCDEADWTIRRIGELPGIIECII